MRNGNDSKRSIKSLTHAKDLEHICERTGRYEATLSDKIKVFLNGDYGFDHSSLYEAHLQQCAEANIFMQVLPLSESIRMRLSLDNVSRDSCICGLRPLQSCFIVTINENRYVI